ncbi:MAG: AIM24 family protein [Pseudonocardiaceae bacterium]
MQVKLRHNPAFTIAHCLLAPGQALCVDRGAMIAHGEGVLLESKAQGGVMKGLAHSVLGGGPFFGTT